MEVNHANLDPVDGTLELFDSTCATNANNGANANSALQDAATCSMEENGEENGLGLSIPPGQPPREGEDEEDMVPVPERLLQPKNAGVSFIRVPKYTWSFNGWAAKLQKQATLTFALDAPCTSMVILEGFEKAGVDVETI